MLKVNMFACFARSLLDCNRLAIVMYFDQIWTRILKVNTTYSQPQEVKLSKYFLMRPTGAVWWKVDTIFESHFCHLIQRTRCDIETPDTIHLKCDESIFQNDDSSEFNCWEIPSSQRAYETSVWDTQLRVASHVVRFYLMWNSMWVCRFMWGLSWIQAI